MNNETLNDKLLDILKESNSHTFEKITQSIQPQTSSHLAIGLSMLNLHETRYIDFENVLIKRDLLSDSIANDLRTYKHAISVLKSYLSQNNILIQSLDAYIYLSYLRVEHGGFIETAQIIDSEYCN